MTTILVIDDEKAILGFLKERLMGEGFNVLTASDGKEGINLFNGNQVDLIITDILMPNKDGFETIFELKKVCPNIKIIAMSGGGHGNPKYYLDTARKYGVRYTLEKPFKTSDLVEAVHALLKEEKTS